MVKLALKFLVEDVDRHGNVRLYFRRKGLPKIRLHGTFGSEQFNQEYAAALARVQPPPTTLKATDRGSMAWLCSAYYKSAAFKQLNKRTQRVRRNILEGLCIAGAGPLPYAKLATNNILKWRDSKVETPEAANALVKALRQLFAFAIEHQLAAENPAREVRYLKGSPDGFHSWTSDEIAQFETRFEVGTQARLALALLFFTVQRRSDVVLLGRQHLRGEELHFTQAKNRDKKPVTLDIPLHPELRRIIESTRCGDLTFLVTEFGRPFTANGFGNRFRRWCDAAGLPPNCAAHGLRKAAASRLAEAGCSSSEIRAFTGHRTSKEVDRYTKAADQKRLAQAAMEKLTANKSVPLETGESVPRQKTKGISIG